MVRVMSASAAVERLENAEIICADAQFGSLKLKADAVLEASDAQTAIVVVGAVTAEGTIPVRPPVNGWSVGRYALLTTATEGLQLELQDLGSATMTYSFETKSGVTTYSAELTAGEIAIVCDEETLTAGAKEQIRVREEDRGGWRGCREGQYCDHRRHGHCSGVRRGG